MSSISTARRTVLKAARSKCRLFTQLCLVIYLHTLPLSTKALPLSGLSDIARLGSTLGQYQSFQLMHGWRQELKNLSQSLLGDTLKQTPIHKTEHYAQSVHKTISQAGSEHALHQRLMQRAQHDPIYQLIKHSSKPTAGSKDLSDLLINTPERDGCKRMSGVGTAKHINGLSALPDSPTEKQISLPEVISWLKTLAGMQNTLQYQPNNPNKIHMFSGTAAHCHKLIHVPLSQSCCNTELKRHGLYTNHCQPKDFVLAFNRKAKRTHTIGAYCSQYVRYPFGKTCVEETQVYCQFPSLLARIIQEKVRAQINSQVAQNAQHPPINRTTPSTEETAITWALEGTKSHWTRWQTKHPIIATWTNHLSNRNNTKLWPVWVGFETPITVTNHQSTSVAGATVSLDCQNQHQCQAHLTTQGLSKSIAFDPTCSHNKANLPQWQLNNIRLSPRHCLEAYNAETQGPPKQLSFHLHSQVLKILHDAHFSWTLARGLKLSGTLLSGQKPHTYKLYLQQQNPALSVEKTLTLPDICNTYTQLEHPLSSPLGPTLITPVCPHSKEKSTWLALCQAKMMCHSLPMDPNWYLPSKKPTFNGWALIPIPEVGFKNWHNITPDLSLKGLCTKKQCRFNLRINHASKPYTMATNLSKISWGTAKKPSCRGLTIEEISAIDWDKIDLSEYTANAHYNPITPEKSEFYKRRLSDGAHLLQHPETGQSAKIPASHPSQSDWVPITIQPLQGQGPFEVTARLAGYWLDPKAQILKIKLYWGDGTMRTIIPTNPKTQKAVHKVRHRYDMPDHHNEIQHILAIFRTTQGIYTAGVDILNIWNNPDEKHELGGGGSLEKEHWVDFNTMPGLGTYH